jgi:hypothetical protein
LREEHKGRDFDNKVLRILNLKVRKMDRGGNCITMNFITCSSPNIVRVIKTRRMMWAGQVTCMGDGRGVYRVLFGRLESKRPLGRPRQRWVYNIKLDLRGQGSMRPTGFGWLRIRSSGELL